MAFPTQVNDQVTDAATQSNLQVVASAPAQAVGALYNALGSALALAASNCAIAQQNGNVLLQTVTTRAIACLLGSAGKG